MLWGMSGSGKTTLAATAPGQKLWVLFDPDGTDSIVGRPDVHVLDLSGERHSVVDRFKVDDPMGIEKMLVAHPEIETVVVDSMTMFSIQALDSAVASGKYKGATLETPGLQAYGHRGALTHRAAVVMLRLTKRLNRHVILISHEDTKDESGMFTVSLSAKQTNNICMQLSEVWWISDTGKEHRIAVRNCRMHEPMKSRMFDAVAAPEFAWKFNPLTWEGEGISTWFNRWLDNGGKKLSLPK